MMAYFLWPYLSSLQKSIAIFIVILVALSRIALAMHYPADILYSLLVVAVIIAVSNRLFILLKDNIVKKVGGVIKRLKFK